MNRPVDWWLLGLDTDPTPGCPERVESLARRLEELAGTAALAGRALRQLRTDDTALAWSGLSRESFGERFGDFPAQLEQVHTAHRTAAAALTAFAPRLRRAQADADRALGAARAHTAHRAALRSPSPAPDAARNLVEQARRLREEAATECARAVDIAAEAALRPRSFWDKLDDAFTMLWDVVHQPAKGATTVGAVVAVLAGGPPVWRTGAGGAALPTGGPALLTGGPALPTGGGPVLLTGGSALVTGPALPTGPALSAMRDHLRGLCRADAPACEVRKDLRLAPAG